MTLTIVDAKTRPIESIFLDYNETPFKLPPELVGAYRRDLLRGKEAFSALIAEGKVHDGNILSLAEVRESEKGLVFSARRFQFEEYFALRNFASGCVQTGTPVNPKLLGALAGLSMITLLETSDNYLVFGHRSGDHLANKYLSPAGFYTHTSAPGHEFFRETVFERVSESLGIRSFSPVHYLGCSHDDRDSFLFVQVFTQKVPLSASDLYKAWEKMPSEKKKHKHLLLVSNRLKPLMDYLFHKGNQVLNTYSEPPIIFEGAKMVSGPETEKNKEYEPIENGVGALLLYIAHKHGRKVAKELCEDLVLDKIVSGVDIGALADGALNQAFLKRMLPN